MLRPAENECKLAITCNFHFSLCGMCDVMPQRSFNWTFNNNKGSCKPFHTFIGHLSIFLCDASINLLFTGCLLKFYLVALSKNYKLPDTAKMTLTSHLGKTSGKQRHFSSLTTREMKKGKQSWNWIFSNWADNEIKLLNYQAMTVPQDCPRMIIISGRLQ